MSAICEGSKDVFAGANVRQHVSVFKNRNGGLRVQQYPVSIRSGARLREHVRVLYEHGSCCRFRLVPPVGTLSRIVPHRVTVVARDARVGESVQSGHWGTTLSKCHRTGLRAGRRCCCPASSRVCSSRVSGSREHRQVVTFEHHECRLEILGILVSSQRVVVTHLGDEDSELVHVGATDVGDPERNRKLEPFVSQCS